MAEHTPGPWIYGGHYNIYARDLHKVYRSRTVASVHGYDLRGGEDEMRANARLIAAAPELLEAIRELLKAVKNATVYEDGALDVMHAADIIAKAEGKS